MDDEKHVFDKWLGYLFDKRHEFLKTQVYPLLASCFGNKLEGDILNVLCTEAEMTKWFSQTVLNLLPVRPSFVFLIGTPLSKKYQVLSYSSDGHLLTLADNNIIDVVNSCLFLLEHEETKQAITRNSSFYFPAFKTTFLDTIRRTFGEKIYGEVSAYEVYGYGVTPFLDVLSVLIFFLPRQLSSDEQKNLDANLFLLSHLWEYLLCYKTTQKLTRQLSQFLSKSKPAVAVFDAQGSFHLGSTTFKDFFLGKNLFGEEVIYALGLSAEDAEEIKKGKTFLFSPAHCQQKLHAFFRNVAYGYIQPDISSEGIIDAYFLVFFYHELSETHRPNFYGKESRYERIFQFIQDLYFEIDVDGNILEVSPSVYNILGEKRENLLGKNILEFYVEPSLRQTYLTDLREKGFLENYIVPLKKTNGEIVYVSVNSTIFQDEEGRYITVGSARNVTSQLKDQEELQLTKLKLETIFNEVPVGLAIFDLDGNLLEINQTLLNMLGSPSPEISKKINFFERAQQQGFPFDKIVKEVFKTGQERMIESGYNTYWGKNIYVQLRIKPLHFTVFNKPVVLLVVEDVSSVQQLKETQKELQLRFNELFNRTSDYVLLLNSAWEIILANEAFKKWSGLSHVGKHSLQAFLTLSDMEILRSVVEKKLWNKIIDLQITNIQNEKNWVELSLTPLPSGENVEEIFIIARDVTKRIEQAKLLEKTIQDKERLVLELHHRLKNVFQVILSLINYYERYFKVHGFSYDYFHFIKQKVFVLAEAYKNFYFKNFKVTVPFIDFLRQLIQTNLTVPCELVLTKDKIDYPIDKAVPLGFALLCMERLITSKQKEANALVKVFPSETSCIIELPFELTENDVHQHVLEWDFLKMMVEIQLNGQIRLVRNKIELYYP